MQFDVYLIGEFLNEELANIWTGDAFIHPSEMSPLYFNKREMPNAYKLIAGLQADRLKQTGGEVRLIKQSFIYQDSIATVTPESAPTLAPTPVSDTITAA